MVPFSYFIDTIRLNGSIIFALSGGDDPKKLRLVMSFVMWRPRTGKKGKFVYG